MHYLSMIQKVLHEKDKTSQGHQKCHVKEMQRLRDRCRDFVNAYFGPFVVIVTLIDCCQLNYSDGLPLPIVSLSSSSSNQFEMHLSNSEGLELRFCSLAGSNSFYIVSLSFTLFCSFFLFI